MKIIKGVAMRKIALLFIVALFVACGSDKESTETSSKASGAEVKQAQAPKKAQAQDEVFINFVDEVKKGLPTLPNKSEAETQQGKTQ